jgi:biotin transport system substrate-specific component
VNQPLESLESVNHIVRPGSAAATGAAPTGTAATGNAAIGKLDNLLRQTGIALAGSALIAICAHLSIPLFFTPVPVSLQPFAVILLGLLLGPRLAFTATATYLAEGAAGLPVFTPAGPGGLLQLFGPTGGYLMSYPLVAPLISWLYRRGARSFSRAAWVAAAGSLVTLAMGALWLGTITHATAATVLSQAILPFLPGDALKVLAAAGIAHQATRFRRNNPAN